MEGAAREKGLLRLAKGVVWDYGEKDCTDGDLGVLLLVYSSGLSTSVESNYYCSLIGERQTTPVQF